MSALSRCIQRGPDHIYTQNYLPCPSFPFCSLQRGRGTTCHIGGSDTDGTPDVWPKHVMGERCGIKSAADCLGCLSADEMCVWINECSRSALRKEARKNFFFFAVRLFLFLLYVLVWTFVYPCSGLVASPSHPTTLLLHSWLPHPSQLPLGLPLAPLLGRAGVLGAPPPVLPGSCCPQLRSCRRYWGRTKSLLLWLCLGPSWEDEEVARRLLLPIKALLFRLSWMLEGWKYIWQA